MRVLSILLMGLACSSAPLDPPSSVPTTTTVPFTVPLVTTPYNDCLTNFTTPRLVFLPAWIPRDVKRVRVTLFNRAFRTGAMHPPFVTDLAVGEVNDAANGWASRPTLLHGVVVTGPGTTTDWIAVSRNRHNGKIGIAAYLPPTTRQNCSVEITTYGFYNANSTDVLGLPGMLPIGDYFIPFGVYLQYEIEPGTRRYVEIGDSLVDGIASSEAVGLEGTLYQLGPRRGLVWAAAGIGGQSFESFVKNPNGPIDHLQLQDAVVILELGTNDITTNHMLVDLDPVVRYLRAQGPAELWIATIPPAAIPPTAPPNGTVDPNREEFNRIVRENLFHADYVFDRDEVLRDPNAPQNMQLQYQSNDGIHWTEAAYRALIDRLERDGKIP